MDEKSLTQLAGAVTVLGIILMMLMGLFEPLELNPLDSEPDPLANNQRIFSGKIVDIRSTDKSTQLTMEIVSEVEVIIFDRAPDFAAGDYARISGTLQSGVGVTVFANSVVLE